MQWNKSVRGHLLSGQNYFYSLRSVSYHPVILLILFNLFIYLFISLLIYLLIYLFYLNFLFVLKPDSDRHMNNEYKSYTEFQKLEKHLETPAMVIGRTRGNLHSKTEFSAPTPFSHPTHLSKWSFFKTTILQNTFCGIYG